MNSQPLPRLGLCGRYFISLRSNHHEQHLWDAEQQTHVDDTPCHGPRRSEFWRARQPNNSPALVQGRGPAPAHAAGI